MTNAIKICLLVLIAVIITGCQSGKPLAVESKFTGVVIGETTGDQLLDMFSGEKVLQTTDRISVLNKSGKFNREVAIATLNQNGASVSRYDYISRVKSLTNVELRVIISGKIAPEVLIKPYESEEAKNLAILRYFHDAMMQDGKAFANDSETKSLIDLASMVYGIGITKLEVLPRDISDISTENGFDYDHTSAGKCKLRLKKSESKDVYYLDIHTESTLDWLVKW